MNQNISDFISMEQVTEKLQALINKAVEQGLYKKKEQIDFDKFSKLDDSGLTITIYEGLFSANDEASMEKDEQFILELLYTPLELPKNRFNHYFEHVSPREEREAGYREIRDKSGWFFKIALSDWGLYIIEFQSGM